MIKNSKLMILKNRNEDENTKNKNNKNEYKN